MVVFDAIPKEWRSIIKTNPYCAPSAMDQPRFKLIIAGKMTDLANVTSKFTGLQGISLVEANTCHCESYSFE